MAYYKSSGKYNFSLVIPGLVVGALASITLAFLYIWLGSLISFIIVKFLLLVISIFVIIEITKLFNRIAKNRNRFISYLAVLLFSAVLLYFSWIFFVVLELNQTFAQAFSNLWDYIYLIISLERYEVTTPVTWFTDTQGPEVGSWAVYIVLGIESIALALGPIIFSIYDEFDTMVFCENCNKWARKKKLILKRYDQKFTKEQLEKLLEEGNLYPLLNLPDINTENKIRYRAYEIRFYCCDTCNSSNYIKIEKTITKSSSKEEEEESSKVLIDYYLLDEMKFREYTEDKISKL